MRKNLAASASVNSVGSRVKALEKAERLEKPLEEPRDVRFEFGFDAQPVKEALSVKNLSVSVGGKKLFENVDLTLFRGEKLAIVGANGVGKTSFIKALTGEIPFSGRVNWGAGVKTGYFEQECRNLVLSNTVYDEVCRHFSLLTPYDVRSLLARALIFGDDVEKRVGELSGANRSKVALAILMRKRPNVLVMDEPTNHLDYKAMEGLDKALSDFDGTLLLVSHDRFLLNRVPTRLAELTPDGFRFFRLSTPIPPKPLKRRLFLKTAERAFRVLLQGGQKAGARAARRKEQAGKGADGKGKGGGSSCRAAVLFASDVGLQILQRNG